MGKKMVNIVEKEQQTVSRKPAKTKTKKTYGKVKQLILDEQDQKCFYCGTVLLDYTEAILNHIIPISAGGRHTKENVVGCCRVCDGDKERVGIESLKIKLAEAQGLSTYVFWGEYHKKKVAATKVIAKFLKATKTIAKKQNSKLYETLESYLDVYDVTWDAEYILLRTVDLYVDIIFGFWEFSDVDGSLLQNFNEIKANLFLIAKEAYPVKVYQLVPECFEQHKEFFG